MKQNTPMLMIALLVLLLIALPFVGEPPEAQLLQDIIVSNYLSGKKYWKPHHHRKAPLIIKHMKELEQELDVRYPNLVGFAASSRENLEERLKK